MKTLRAGLALMLVAAGVQGQTPTVPLRLVRCTAGADVPCLVARVVLDARSAALVGQLDSTDESRAWTGALAGARLAGPGVAVAQRVEPPLRLLVLLDRSGSMTGEGIAFTRITLRSFIGALDSATVRVAVAGFESRDVSVGIDASRFVPPAEAVRVLEQIPSPDVRANTALYSALVDGSRHVAAAVAAAPGTQGAILLVTDGRNEVGFARDDPGLLAGPDGLARARAALEASGQKIWIMGVGQHVAADELASLAGGGGVAVIARLDPNAMAERLAVISRELRGARELTFGVSGGAAASLARAPWVGAAAAWRDGRPLVTQALAWRPPLYALPAYDGVADAASLPAGMRDAGTGAAGGPGTRLLIALSMGLVGALLWVFVPRVAWMGSSVLPTAAEPAAPASAPRKAPAEAENASGLRRDVQEAPPRKPSDVTAEIPVGGP